MPKPLVFEGPLGPSASSDGRDIVKAKNALETLGFFEPRDGEVTPFTEQGLFEGIKNFQGENGLSPTGELRPGDRTVLKLREQLAGRDSATGEAKEPLEGSVGAGGTNNAVDLDTAKKLLTQAGQLEDTNFGSGPKLNNAIRTFQANVGLNPDGVIKPGSETAELLVGAADVRQREQVPSAMSAEEPDVSRRGNHKEEQVSAKPPQQDTPDQDEKAPKVPATEKQIREAELSVKKGEISVAHQRKNLEDWNRRFDVRVAQERVFDRVPPLPWLPSPPALFFKFLDKLTRMGAHPQVIDAAEKIAMWRVNLDEAEKALEKRQQHLEALRRSR
ncbi:MAG: peptidoglycan-binding protein [Proteobacteria bacterium]|nr:peptidoglycan-binding protein [Pseudomonadota bacterium]